MSKQLYIGRVVGINHSPARENFDGLIKKFNTMPLDKINFDVQLEAEPDNPYDELAIKVMFGNKGESLVKIGYIPKPQNSDLYRHGVGKCTVEVIKLNKMDDRVVGMDILVKGE